MSRFLQPYESLALSLIFEFMGETRINSTYDEYMAIAARLPHLKELHFQVNLLLAKFNKRRPTRTASICYFRKGDLKAH